MEPFIGMIIGFAFPRVPTGWAACNGQLLQIAQYNALFALLGTTYGGDGIRTFALPDLRGRAIAGIGQGQGIESVVPGEVWGNNTVTLLQTNLPAHTHPAHASDVTASSANPAGLAYAPANDSGGISFQCYGTPDGTAMTPTSLAGGNQPVSIRNPYLGINYCIATVGIFPSRN